MIKDYGFRPPVIDKNQYVLGGFMIPTVPLQEDGNWQAYLPQYEPQFGDGWDTFGCTIWGTENALEILYKKIFNEEANYSERFLYIVTHTRPPGNDPHEIAEAIRKNGLVDDDVLPMTKSYEEFKNPDPLDVWYLAAGQEWLNDYEFMHEWLWTGELSHKKKIERLKEMLRFSPLGVSVTAWKEENGLYVDNGRPNTHWCVLFKFDGDKPVVFDSYDQSIKTLHPDHNIQFAKRYHLSAKLKKSCWFKKYIEEIFK